MSRKPKSISLATADRSAHYEHIIHQLTMSTALMDTVKIRGPSKAFIDAKDYIFTGSVLGAVEEKKCTDYHFMMDASRPMYKKVYKINLRPILFLVDKGDGRWLIANHYFLCQDWSDNIHLYADYDPHMEKDPKVKEFNARNSCNMKNFLNVIEYMAAITDKLPDGRQLDPDKGIVSAEPLKKGENGKS